MKVLIPDYAAPLDNDAGEILLAHRLYREALPFLQARYDKDTENPRARVALGLCLFYHDRVGEAEEMLTWVTANNPGDAMGWHALANVVEGLGRFDEALTYYQNAVRINRDGAAINYGVASNLLRQGRCEEAWPYWEAGRTRIAVDDIPAWEGQELVGKQILVIREGGYGDVLWLMRYLPLLQALGAKVTLYSFTGFRGLIGKHPWLDRYTDSAEIMETEGFDYQISLMSLMAVFNRCPLPVSEPYIEAWRPFPRNGRKRIGVNWRAGEAGGVVRRIRGMEKGLIEPFRAIDAEFVNLQIEEKPPDWIEDNREVIKGWHNTANCLASVDAVVTVDSALGHLSGAMGKPTVILLPLNFEFKWAHSKAWYPSVQTARSTSPFTLAPAVEKAVEMVRGMV